jgi:hypothetical protein
VSKPLLFDIIIDQSDLKR